MWSPGCRDKLLRKDSMMTNTAKRKKGTAKRKPGKYKTIVPAEVKRAVGPDQEHEAQREPSSAAGHSSGDDSQENGSMMG